MNKQLTFISGLGLGAGLMYWFDPDKGRRRRAQVRDQLAHTARVAGDTLDKASRDISNRIDGLIAEMGSMLKREAVSDDVLVARVRAKLGRVVSHPHAIEVRAERGRVTLRGPVLAGEVDELLKAVSAVPGVREVENQLEVHERPDDVPALQGELFRSGEQSLRMRTNWPPATRLLVGAAGGALALYGAQRRGAVGAAMETLGLGLLVRGLTNLEMKELIGLDGSRGIHVQKTINIDAPIERVFEIWTHQENFPQFMSRVRKVRKLGDGRYHWTVVGPAGIPVEWEATVTHLVPNQLLAWKSVPGSTVEQTGVVRFQPNDDGSTRIDIRLSYHPPAGAVGHAVAKLFGADPKSEMDADLMRLKSFIETGHQPHDAAQHRVAQRGGYLQ